MTVTISLTSNDATGDALVLSQAKALTVSEPVSGISRISVAHTAATNILTSAGNTDDTYVYLKNTDATNFVEVMDDAGNVLIQLNPGESNFITVQGSIGLEVQADTAACVVEYGFWTKS